jgi:diadenosine tetraphosphate (Ap4A) HIT family hydrolase
VNKVVGCLLCDGPGGAVVAKAARWRIVRADEPGFPGFYRLVWNEHVREFSDLSAADRAGCMDVLVQVETLIRSHLQPRKVNIASLGNAVPHLHWHVIARYDWDSHFPGAVWGQSLREPAPERLAEVGSRLAALETALGKLAAAA